jgi:hypothetical protein
VFIRQLEVPENGQTRLSSYVIGVRELRAGQNGFRKIHRPEPERHPTGRLLYTANDGSFDIGLQRRREYWRSYTNRWLAVSHWR